MTHRGTIVNRLIDWALRQKYATAFITVGLTFAGILVYISAQFYLVFSVLTAIAMACLDGLKLLAAYTRPKFRDSALPGTTAVSVLLAVVTLVGSIFSGIATVGWLADRNDEWHAKTVVKTTPYKTATAELKRNTEKLAAIGWAQQAARGNATKLNNIQTQLNRARTRMAKYVNDDGSFRTDSHGRPFRTAGNAAKAEVQQLTTQYDALAATAKKAQQAQWLSERITALRNEIATMDGNSAQTDAQRPIFGLVARVLKNRGYNATAENVAIAFYTIIAIVLEISAIIAMGMVHRAALLGAEERSAHSRMDRIESALETMVKHGGKESSLPKNLANMWESFQNKRTPEYIKGFNDARVGKRADNIYKTTPRRKLYNLGFDDGHDEYLRNPPEEKTIAPAQLPQQAVATPSALMSNAPAAKTDADYLVYPILERQGQMIIHAFEGVGKTWLILEVMKLMTQGGEAFGRWRATTAVDVLYVDGEMGAGEMASRCQLMGITSQRAHFLDALQLEGTPPNICTPEGQQVIEHYISETRSQAVILDSALVLSNERFQFSKERGVYQEWVGKLKSRGIAVILINHDSKTGDQHGQRIQSMKVDTRIQLKATNGDVGSGPVLITFKKARHFHTEDKEPILATFSNGVWETAQQPQHTTVQQAQRGMQPATKRNSNASPGVAQSQQPTQPGTANVVALNAPFTTQRNATQQTTAVRGETPQNPQILAQTGGSAVAVAQPQPEQQNIDAKDICGLIKYPHDEPSEAKRTRNILAQLNDLNITPTPALISNLASACGGKPINRGTAHRILKRG